jgi:hypothetical protein
MSIKQIDAPKLQRWVKALLRKHQVLGVQARGDRFLFAPLARAEHLRLDYDVSITAPTRLLQPMCETLLTFTRGAGEYRSVVPDDPFILFGVHPYDLVAINQMDTIFAADRPDIHYLARRRNATIVACDIQSPSRNIFASCMGTATVQEGFDILISRVGDRYVVDSRTDKGEALMADLPRAPSPTRATLARREQLWDDAGRLFVQNRLKCRPEDLPGILSNGSYEHPIWERKAALCFSCGQCTMVCPTCYCFDVADELSWDMEAGERLRRLDSCQLTEFALVAGGHNFRKQREARYRHRFYRKGKYIWDRFGYIACVGCGRCITACPAQIANIVEVYNTLAEDK